MFMLIVLFNCHTKNIIPTAFMLEAVGGKWVESGRMSRYFGDSPANSKKYDVIIVIFGGKFKFLR